MRFPTTAEERAALEHCLGAYLDNESDKGTAGIGSDVGTILLGWLELCRAGDDAALTVDLLRLAHIQKALEIYAEDDQIAQAVVAGLLSRIERAIPAIIPLGI